MNDLRHKIQKQVLEFYFPGYINNKRFQERISQLYQDKLLPILERILNEYSPAGTSHYISRISLDLGEINLDRLEQMSTACFEAALRKELKEKLSYTPSMAISDPEKTETPSLAQKHKTPPQHTNASGGLWELFDLFIETGTLPWQHDHRDPGIISRAFDSLIKDSPERLKTRFIGWLKYQPLRKRIISQFNEDHLFSIADLLLPGTILSELKLARTREQNIAKGLWWDTFFISLNDFLVNRSGVTESKQGKRLIKSFSKQIKEKVKNKQISKDQGEKKDLSSDPNFKDSLNTEIGDRQDRSGISGIEKDAPEDRSINEKNPDDRIDKTDAADPNSKESLNTEIGDRQDRSGVSGIEKDATEDRSINEKIPVDRIDKADAESPLTSAHEIEELYIANSGLVILWPFYNRFFEQIGIMEDRQFTSLANQNRAVFMLQVLASGDGEVPEYMLQLNKILCGIPVNNPLEPLEPFMKEEIADCEVFLKAVIEQVPILNNMSIDGFRGSFLLREGILKPQPAQWNLYVKRETFDVVIDRFPWPYNIVRLPWMDRLIYVEW